MISEYNFVKRIVKDSERKFGGITFAYRTKPNNGWNICVNNARLYMTEDFNKFCIVWHKVSKRLGISIIFCYCDASENKLVKLSEDSSLILNCY
jgi:hypothetical protein